MHESLTFLLKVDEHFLMLLESKIGIKLLTSIDILSRLLFKKGLNTKSTDNYCLAYLLGSKSHLSPEVLKALEKTDLKDWWGFQHVP
jgi:hypothetical protein